MVGDILQPTHLLFILVVALLVLGPKRLPEVGRTLGSGLRDFRQAINGEATSRDDDEPRAYVETESDDIVPATDAGPAFAAGEAASDETEKADDHAVDHEPEWADESDPATSDDAADLDAGTVEPATATHDEAFASAVPAAEPAPQRAATASSTGFASALAASRQQSSGDDEPSDDE